MSLKRRSGPGWLAAAVLLVAFQGRAAVAGFGDLLLKLTPHPEATQSRFGVSVALDDGVAVVGSLEETNLPQSGAGSPFIIAGSSSADFGIDGIVGAAYQYRLPAGELIARTVQEAGDNNPFSPDFGEEVAIAAGTVFVADEEYERDPSSARGAVFMYSAATGEPTGKLALPAGESSLFFGHSVDVDGATALVSDYRAFTNGAATGAVHVFDLGTGEAVNRLVPGDVEASDAFGFSVSLDGDAALVGASEQDRGAAYLFDLTTGTEPMKLVPDFEPDTYGVGHSVALGQGLALVGAPGFSGAGAGEAFLFDAATGQQVNRFTAPNGASGDRFGVSVAIDEGVALIGASGSDASQGAVYAYALTTGHLLAKLTARDGAVSDAFGYSLAIDDGFALVGALDKDGLGAAYVFDVRIPEPSQAALALLAMLARFAPLRQ